MKFVDTHCHLQDSEFYLEDREDVYLRSIKAEVAMICVGTNAQSSREAVKFCQSHANTYPVVGIHPHDTATGDVGEIRTLVEEYHDKIIGIGEIGLDYFYTHSPREQQIKALRQQLTIAQEFNLPVSFHVREAFEDFWPILDEFPGIRGVLHSFTDTQDNCDEAIRRGLYIGINGISTFTKNSDQQRLFAQLPLEKILLETDAPFLTPVPFRGKVNIPAYVGRVAEYQSVQKGCTLDDVAQMTTDNAMKLFGISL